MKTCLTVSRDTREFSIDIVRRVMPFLRFLRAPWVNERVKSPTNRSLAEDGGGNSSAWWEREETSRGVALILRSSHRLYFIVPRKRFLLGGRSIDRSIGSDRLSMAITLVGSCLHTSTVTTSEYEFLPYAITHVLENLVERSPKIHLCQSSSKPLVERKFTETTILPLASR